VAVSLVPRTSIASSDQSAPSVLPGALQASGEREVPMQASPRTYIPEIPEPLTLSLNAMATRFELVLYGWDHLHLRAAGEEALREIERIEAQLSFYRAGSEVSFLNRTAATRAVKVEVRLFRLLQDCLRLSELTEGAFDITVGPLMRAWRFVDGQGRVPDRDELEAATSVVGSKYIELDQTAHTVRFTRRGVEIDLGAYGKGYAIERAVALLKESGITSSLIHGGTSSVYAIGAPPRSRAWRVRLARPATDEGSPLEVDLCNFGLSVSAVQGKFFEQNGVQYGHVIDPRGGQPVCGSVAAAVLGPSPTECEALSTALLVLGQNWRHTMLKHFPGYLSWVA
jgi:FAD:protein FMN transferase